MRRFIALLIPLLSIGGTVSWAQEYGPDPYLVTTNEIAPGVYVIQRPLSYRTPVLANVTVVVNDSDLVVVDGGGLPAHSDHVIAAVKKISSKPVSVILTTHWHGDHNMGLAEWRRAYPGVRIVAHRMTRYYMANGAMGYVDDFVKADLTETLAGLDAELARMKAEGFAESVLELHRKERQDYPDMVDQYRRSRWLLADETFDDRLVLHRGDRTIEFLFLGRANTEGDALMWLPRERILVAGDIVVHPTPYAFGTHPAEWGATLRRIQEIDYAQLVPGHGEVQQDHQFVGHLADLMESVARQAREAVERGVDSPEAMAQSFDLSPFEAIFAGDDPLLRFMFQDWFTVPVMRNAFREAAGLEIKNRRLP